MTVNNLFFLAAIALTRLCLTQYPFIRSYEMPDLSNNLTDSFHEYAGVMDEPKLTEPTAIASSVQPDAQLNNDCFASNIVIIDDEPSVTSVIKKELSDAGFLKANPFNNPTQALLFIAEQGADVVLLDLKIPEIDGISVLKYLRARKTTRFVPVIVLTSSIDDKTRIEALTAGANDYLTKPVNARELIQRVKNALYFKNYADGIERQIELVEQELRIDTLTGLENRRSFDEHFGQSVNDSDGQKLSLIIFDIDHFKFTNDTYGHDAGDGVLKQLATIVRTACGPDDFAARIGGDEFAIVCKHEDPEWPRRLAEEIRSRSLSEPVDFDGKAIKSTISLGIASYGDRLPDCESLFKAADAALYQSKRQGRNAINVYSNAGSVSIGNNHLTQVPDPMESRGHAIDPRQGRILIVDDEPTVTQMLVLQLNKSGYPNVEVEHDATKAIARVQTTMPDLVILDIRMPKINGLEILRAIKENKATTTIPVLIMTSSNDNKIRLASLKLQANDFLTKPANGAELDARVFNSLKIKFQHDQLVTFSNRLTHEVEIRTSELFATRRETILCLARAAETRDTETGNHVIRVGHYAAIIARQMGMDEDNVGWIELAAQLHDVGKLSIPDSILRKPGALTADERKVVETHCEQADRIFFGRSPVVEKATITSPLLKMAARIASTHHERWDGAGYPRGLMGDGIPLEGRITAVADVFDALGTKRHYKDAYDAAKCIQMIVSQKGKHFDPEVVEAFIAAKAQILNAMEQWQDFFTAE